MYRWNEDKNAMLKATRGFSFEDVVVALSLNGSLDNYKHPNAEKYPNQYIYVLMLDGYTHFVPYVIEDDYIFLKNIIPSRKLHKQYKGDSNGL